MDPGVSTSTFDVARGLTNGLRRQGHEVIRYMLSARIPQADYALQYAWKRLGKPQDTLPTQADVYYYASEGILTFALRHMPDWVLIVTAQFIHPDFLVFLERARMNVALVLTESPYGDRFQAHVLPAVDCGWTQERTSLDRLRAANENVRYLAAAYDPELHHPDLMEEDEGTPAHDVVLVATCFPERYLFLREVDWGGADVGLYGDWRVLPARSRLRRYLRDGLIDNRKTASLYRKAKIGINLYRDGLVLQGKPGGDFSYDGADKVDAQSLNPRALELAACGCLQISQYRAEVEEVFGDSVPIFTTPDELSSLIDVYLSDDDARRTLANESRRRAADHTFDARGQQIVEDLSELGLPSPGTDAAFARPTANGRGVVTPLPRGGARR